MGLHYLRWLPRERGPSKSLTPLGLWFIYLIKKFRAYDNFGVNFFQKGIICWNRVSCVFTSVDSGRVAQLKDVGVCLALLIIEP